MTTRILFALPLALALAACGSSNSGQQASPMPPPAATVNPTAAPEATASTAATPVAAPASPATATAAATSAEAITAAPAVNTTSADTGMDADAKAALAKAAKSFSDNGKWVEGKNYFIIDPQQPRVTDTDKVEVVEIFSYGCPACNAAHKTMDKMRAELPPFATMTYLPAGFRPDENWVLYQRAYYAAKALGIAAKTYDAMFDATWKSGETATYDLSTGRPKPRAQWATLDDIAAFYAHHGVSAEQFKAVANSFAVNTQIKRADKLVQDYGTRSTPTIVIDGKYRFTFVSAGSYPKGIELAQWLVAKEAADRQ